MDDETVKHLWALREVNKAIIERRKTAIFVLENKEDLSKERGRSLIESFELLIVQSEEIYGKEETRH